MQSIEIYLITTGGTIDGADLDSGTSRGGSDAAKWLIAQPGVKASIVSPFNKDSRSITDTDRADLVQLIRRSSSTAILITHGTFTIAATGRALKSALPDTKRTVVLVGSWLPFGTERSDAPMQMQFALRSLHDASGGVWIAMDNRLWDPDTTEKVEFAPGQFRLVEVMR